MTGPAGPKKPSGPIAARLVGGPVAGHRYRLAHDTPEEIMLNMGRDLYRRRPGSLEWHWVGPRPLNPSGPGLAEVLDPRPLPDGWAELGDDPITPGPAVPDPPRSLF